MEDGNVTIGYDVIGDVHGSAEKLTGLLGLLGWSEDADGIFRHDEDLQVVFAGDLVDRGPGQRRVLEIARKMVDAGTALIVMGNHELNHIGFATPRPDGDGYLRAHSEKNVTQSQAFLDQIPEPERSEWIDWFTTLPMWLELDGLRIVHACWHQESIDLLRRELGGAHLRDLDDLLRAHDKEDPVWKAVEVLLKGPEIDLDHYGLPAYRDKGGHPRDAARVRWWAARALSIADLIDIPHGTTTADGDDYPEVPALPFRDHDASYAYTARVPVVYGHHWRDWEPSEHLDYTDVTACVDFSAVNGGPLVAYQWRGETTIDPTHYERYPAILHGG
jgi:hypothetical protein